MLVSINNVDFEKINLITWLGCILQTKLWNEIFWSVKYTLVTWSIWYFANRYYLLILAPGENFKSIWPLDHSKWYPSNGAVGIYRPVCKIPTRQVADSKFCTKTYIINIYHWCKFEVKSTSGSGDTEFHYLYFTDQVCKLHNMGQNQVFWSNFTKAMKIGIFVKIWYF